MSTVSEKKISVTDSDGRDDEKQRDYVSPAEERVLIRAARLQLATDKKQGIDSPAWVKQIAGRPL